MKKIAILFLSIWALMPAQAQSPISNEPQTGTIVWDKTEHDFGQINEEKGKVDVTFYFTNTGKVPVKISNVHASCGCTATDYTKEEVLPNKTGFVKATFDPAFKKGEFTKTVNVQANTTQAFHILAIKGNVIPRPKGPTDWFPQVFGGLRFETNHIAYGNVTNNKVDTGTTRIYNQSQKPIRILGFDAPAFLKITPSKLELKPGEIATISSEYDAKAVNDYGWQFHNVTMKTTDSVSPSITMYFSATIDEYFPKLSAADSLKAPRIQFVKTMHNFGTITSGDVVNTEFIFQNVGKSELLIRKTKASCGCTATQPDKTVLQPGDSARIKVTFNSSGKQGNESKSITVISNDPYGYSQNLTISANILPVKKEETPVLPKVEAPAPKVEAVPEKSNGKKNKPKGK